MRPWLVFIESNTSGTGRLFARAAAQQGLQPILLTDDPLRYGYVTEDRLPFLQINTKDKEALSTACRRLARAEGLAGITTSSEYFVTTASMLARQFRLPGPDPSALRLCRDKYRQRMRLQEDGINLPSFQVAGSVKEAVKAARKLRLPVIVKPVSGSGSVGVKLCPLEQDVAAQAALLLRQRHNERGLPIPRRILVESVIVGPEYSVETFNLNIIGMTRKYLAPLPDFVEIGHDFPARLPDKVKEQVHDVVRRSLESLGLGWGPAHIELRLTGTEPAIIEVNPRLAGGYIPELVRLASGIDLISETIRLVRGEQTGLRQSLRRFSSIRFLLPQQEGILIRAEGLQEALQISGVVDAKLSCQPGKRVQYHGDFRDRVGYVIACGKTAGAARRAAESAHALIQLRIEPS
jgi:argininosuccinate lyase